MHKEPKQSCRRGAREVDLMAAEMSGGSRKAEEEYKFASEEGAVGHPCRCAPWGSRKQYDGACRNRQKATLWETSGGKKRSWNGTKGHHPAD
jgi:hypothetical protein